MPLFSLVRYKFCERCSGEDSFKRFSVSNDIKYGSAGFHIAVSYAGDEGVACSVDKTVRDSTQILVPDDYTVSVRKVLCVRVVTYQHMEGSCLVRSYRLYSVLCGSTFPSFLLTVIYNTIRLSFYIHEV